MFIKACMRVLKCKKYQFVRTICDWQRGHCVFILTHLFKHTKW